MYLEEKYVDCEQYFTNDCKCCYDRIREFVYDMSVYCTSCDELQFSSGSGDALAYDSLKSMEKNPIMQI